MRTVEKRQESLHCLFACTVTMQAGQNAKDFFLLKVLVLSFQFLQVGKRCQFCINKLNIGKKVLFSSVVIAMVFAIRGVKHGFHCTGKRIVRKFREFCIHYTFM